VQYPGPVAGPAFEVSAAFGTKLGHAAAAIRFGELEMDAVEFGAIFQVLPRFFQGAKRPGDACFDAYQGLLGLGFPAMARGHVASPMAQFIERGAGDGFAIQICPWGVGHRAGTGAPVVHAGHFWLGGWDSYYTAAQPRWETLTTCVATSDNRVTECTPQDAWTPRAYGLRLASIAVGSGPPLDMPVDLNAKGRNQSDASPGAWEPFYTTVMPEASQLWLNAAANAAAVTAALAASGYVQFTGAPMLAEQHEFWTGRTALQGRLTAAAKAAGAGLTLRFSGGTVVTIDADDALFEALPNGVLKQIGFDGAQGHTETIVGLSAYVDHVVLFDHAERRIGFAQGQNCEMNPREGDPGYTRPDHIFGSVPLDIRGPNEPSAGFGAAAVAGVALAAAAAAVALVAGGALAAMRWKGVTSPGRESYSDTLYISLLVLHTKYPGRAKMTSTSTPRRDSRACRRAAAARARPAKPRAGERRPDREPGGGRRAIIPVRAAKLGAGRLASVQQLDRCIYGIVHKYRVCSCVQEPATSTF
jgi:hypothetical protein